MTRRNRVVSRQCSVFRERRPRGFTLVEMLIAMAITLVMIGAVVTLFANISNSVRNRRAVIELSGQMRHARNMLQQDLQGATCNGLVWQRPDENQGYIEIIEGPYREGNASALVDRIEEPDPSSSRYNPEIDHTTSLIPASNVPFPDSRWVTDGGSLGDYDDILMLTVRNEHEPFVGRVPLADGSAAAVRPTPSSEVANAMNAWKPTTITSPLAEVIWYAIENPSEGENSDVGNFFGEPGMRTIYRRALLVAPFLNPYRHIHPNTGEVTDTFRIPRDGATFTAQPGLVRVLPDDIGPNNVAGALACLVAFQERYDLSVRLEFDPLLGDSTGRWKIVANTLGDLTKRENRYGHYGYGYDSTRTPARFWRNFPFPMISLGIGQSNGNLSIVSDPELPAPTSPAQVRATTSNGNVIAYELRDQGAGYPAPPFLHLDDNRPQLATARAMLNDNGEIVRVIHGPAPLAGERRGEDVMLSDALGFDLRVYDPGAPLFAHLQTETILQPTDPAWTTAYMSPDNLDGGESSIGRNNSGGPVFPFVGQGAYVDLGYGVDLRRAQLSPPLNPQLYAPKFASSFSTATRPWFFAARALSDVYGNQLAPGYAVFDTWSFHYENNGLNEDNDATLTTTGAWVYPYNPSDATHRPLIDEAVNGLDDVGSYADGFAPSASATNPNPRLGPDDVGERETVPPYDKPLRGIQAVLRLYERDSRQVRQVSVNQSFVPE